MIQACRAGRFVGAIDPPEWLKSAVAFAPSRELIGVYLLPGMESAPFSRYYPLRAGHTIQR